MALTILGVTFFGFLLLGVPVAFAIGLSAVCTILYEGLPVAVLFQQMMSGMNIFSFLAIPFFVFSGELMLHGGIADKIVAAARNMVGHIRGGLGMSNVVACTLFGGVSGSPVADVSAMGSVMIPMMKREGYHADYAVNVTTHAALVGALMPTSHNMIIYSLAAGGKVSIGALIAGGHRAGAGAHGVHAGGGLPRRGEARLSGAGRLPGLERDVALDRRRRARAAGDRDHPGGHPLAASSPPPSRPRSRWSTRSCSPSSLYRTMTLGEVPQGGGQGGEDHRRGAAADRRLDHVPVPDGRSTRWPTWPARRWPAISTNPWVVFLLINVILFLLGTFMDMASTILICTPIFLPIAMTVRHGPGAVRHGDADQLRARAQHAARGHDAVRRLRDRRHLGGRGDAHDPAVLCGAARGAAAGHLRAGVLPHPAAACSAMQ